jgi:hypothetical protein
MRCRVVVNAWMVRGPSVIVCEMRVHSTRTVCNRCVGHPRHMRVQSVDEIGYTAGTSRTQADYFRAERLHDRDFIVIAAAWSTRRVLKQHHFARDARLLSLA